MNFADCFDFFTITDLENVVYRIANKYFSGLFDSFDFECSPTKYSVIINLYDYQYLAMKLMDKNFKDVLVDIIKSKVAYYAGFEVIYNVLN